MAQGRSPVLTSLPWAAIGACPGLYRFFFAVMAMFLTACVPQGDYLRLEAECDQELILEKDRCLEQSRRSREENASLQNALKAKEVQSQQEAQRYRNQLAKAQISVRELQKKNVRLQKHLNELGQDLEKRQSIISLQNQVIRTLDDTKRTIETSLKKQIAAQGIEVEDLEGRLKVKFVDRILFDSGKVALNPGGRKLLLTFAESVRDDSLQLIQVRGYTDNTPIGPILKDQFPSNWELSAARALAVVHFLQDEAELLPRRLSACALGSYRPIADNATEKGRRQNRRIEIIIYPSASPFALPSTKATQQP